MARKTQEIKREMFATDEEFVDALIGTFSGWMRKVAHRNRDGAIALTREGWDEDNVRLELMSNITLSIA